MLFEKLNDKIRNAERQIDNYQYHRHFGFNIFTSFYLQNNYVELDSEASVLVILSYMTSICGLLVCLIIYAANWRCVKYLSFD